TGRPSRPRFGPPSPGSRLPVPSMSPLHRLMPMPRLITNPPLPKLQLPSIPLRMQIGICVPPTELQKLPTPPDYIDYIEGHVQQFLLPEEPEAAFQPQLEALRACGKTMPACNSLFPPELKTSGPDVDLARIDAYI